VETQISSDDKAGTLLDGRYELRERLGQGGMAVVWRGVLHGAAGFRCPVAINRINPEYRGYPEVIEMFVEEARVGAALRHPNIVQAFDFRKDDEGNYYLVTELVDGPHLGQWVDAHRKRNKAAPWAITAAIAIEVLQALEAAHTRINRLGDLTPVLHRDVTPGNILLDRCGVTKLADFGLARAMDRAPTTRPNVVKGKLSYLAPELVRGEVPSVQSDIFSLGVVLWETLSGKRLFDGETDIDVYRMLQNPKVPLLSMQRSDLPMGITTAVHRALDANPQKRFTSARAMGETLAEALRILPSPPAAAAVAASIELVLPTLNLRDH
jgi:serine/threonine-protein kinase